MATAVAANTTCDIYRNGHAPPEVPAVAGVRCFLLGDYERRMNTANKSRQSALYPCPPCGRSHRHSRRDQCLHPHRRRRLGIRSDQNGTRFRVVFVELQAGGCLPVAKRYTSIATTDLATDNL